MLPEPVDEFEGLFDDDTSTDDEKQDTDKEELAEQVARLEKQIKDSGLPGYRDLRSNYDKTKSQLETVESVNAKLLALLQGDGKLPTLTGDSEEAITKTLSDLKKQRDNSELSVEEYQDRSEELIERRAILRAEKRAKELFEKQMETFEETTKKSSVESEQSRVFEAFSKIERELGLVNAQGVENRPLQEEMEKLYREDPDTWEKAAFEIKDAQGNFLRFGSPKTREKLIRAAHANLKSSGRNVSSFHSLGSGSVDSHTKEKVVLSEDILAKLSEAGFTKKEALALNNTALRAKENGGEFRITFDR